MFLEPAQSLNRILDRVEGFLKDDLLRGMLKLLAGQPAPMRQRPVAGPAENPAVTQQEGKQLLAFAAKIVRRRLAGSHKVADRLVGGVRRPHSCELAGPMQSRQSDRIAPVRLHPLARTFRDQSRSDHHAVVTESSDLTIKPISSWPGLKADVQPLVSLRQSPDRPLNRQGAVLDIAKKPNLSRPASFRDCNRVLLFSHIERDKDFAILSHGPPSVREAPLGLPEQPSFLPARKGGPPARAREHDVLPAAQAYRRCCDRVGVFHRGIGDVASLLHTRPTRSPLLRTSWCRVISGRLLKRTGTTEDPVPTEV